MTHLMYQHKDIAIIEKLLNEDFEDSCDWFIDYKLSVHFRDDKTKSILFASKRRAKNMRKLNIRYKEINITQQVQVTYLGCVLDESISDERMALKVVNKINGKLKFLFRKNNFLTSELRRMLCTAYSAAFRLRVHSLVPKSYQKNKVDTNYAK